MIVFPFERVVVPEQKIPSPDRLGFDPEQERLGFFRKTLRIKQQNSSHDAHRQTDCFKTGLIPSFHQGFLLCGAELFRERGTPESRMLQIDRHHILDQIDRAENQNGNPDQSQRVLPINDREKHQQRQNDHASVVTDQENSAQQQKKNQKRAPFFQPFPFREEQQRQLSGQQQRQYDENRILENGLIEPPGHRIQHPVPQNDVDPFFRHAVPVQQMEQPAEGQQQKEKLDKCALCHGVGDPGGRPDQKRMQDRVPVAELQGLHLVPLIDGVRIVEVRLVQQKDCGEKEEADDQDPVDGPHDRRIGCLHGIRELHPEKIRRFQSHCKSGDPERQRQQNRKRARPVQRIVESHHKQQIACGEKQQSCIDDSGESAFRTELPERKNLIGNHGENPFHGTSVPH